MKFVYGAAVLVAILIAVAFVAPYIMDWGWLKPSIAERAEAILGRKLAIDGPIEVRFLPAPRISVSDARLANLPGAGAADMARAKRVDLELALGPLIGGRIEVVDLTLIDPVIELERLKDGAANWQFTPEATPPAAAARSEPAGAEGSGQAEAAIGTKGLRSITLANGALTYRDWASGAVEHLRGVEATVTAREEGGPYQLRGRMWLREAALSVEGVLGRGTQDAPTPLSLALGVADADAQASFEGSVERTAMRLAGKLTAKGSSLGAALAPFGLALPAEAGSSDEPFALSGTLAGGSDRFDLKDLDLRLGDTMATGALAYVDGAPAQLDLLLALNRLDLDRIFAGGAGPAPEPGTPAEGSDAAAAPRGEATADAADDALPIPTDLNASVNLTIEAVQYRGAVIRAVQSILSLEQGTVSVQQASAELPGGGDASLVGTISAPKQVPTFEGMLDLRADDLRALAGWLGMEIGGAPAERLRRFSMKATLRATDRAVLVPRLDARLDSSVLTGSLSVETGRAVRPGLRPQITASLTLDRLTLDAYLEGAGVGPVATPARATDRPAGSVDEVAATAAAAPRASWLDGYDIAGTLHIAKLSYGETVLSEVDVNPLWRDGVLTLGEVRVGDFAGVVLEASGTARALDGPEPRFTATVKANAASLGALGRLLGLEPSLRLSSLGHTSLEGELQGGPEALAVDARLISEAGELSLKGDLSNLRRTPQFAFDIELRNASEETLRGLLGARPAVAGAPPTPLWLKGRLSGDQRALALAAETLAIGPTEVSGDLALRLDGPRPYVRADLKSPQLVAPSGDAAEPDPAALAPAAGRPGEADTAGLGRGTPRDKPRGTPARWSREPFDLDLLTRFDGDLRLSAERLALGDWLVRSATVEASLKEGVLDLGRLEGRLFDGALTGAARVGAGPRPTFFVDFTLMEADIDALLRAVGEADAATGRVTLSGQLTTEGASAHALINALDGPLAVSGHDGSLEGIDLAPIRLALNDLGALSDLENLARLNLSRGSTPVRTLDGTINFTDGVARTDDLKAVSDSGTCVIAGSASLPRWHLDGTAICDLGEGAAERIGVRLVGPIDRPARQFLLDDFVTALGKRAAAQALREQGLNLKLRKGAKAEPGSIADQLLRGVFGNPDASAAEPSEEDSRIPREPAPEQEREAPRASAPELFDLLKRVIPEAGDPP
jgi:uncharacterized protein involved in outer membrane biogenesis